jgi:hypothetical protein
MYRTQQKTMSTFLNLYPIFLCRLRRDTIAHCLTSNCVMYRESDSTDHSQPSNETFGYHSTSSSLIARRSFQDDYHRKAAGSVTMSVTTYCQLKAWAMENCPDEFAKLPRPNIFNIKVKGPRPQPISRSEKFHEPPYTAISSTSRTTTYQSRCSLIKATVR